MLLHEFGHGLNFANAVNEANRKIVDENGLTLAMEPKVAFPEDKDEMAKAVSLVLVVLIPSERQAISSSRSASQARPIGSRRSRSVTQLVSSAKARIR